MNLYELTGNLMTVINGGMVVDDITGEIKFEPEDLEALEGEYADKLEGCGVWCKNEKAEIEALRAEEKNLAERRRVKENKLQSMKDYILKSMEATDTTKLETTKVAMSTRKSQRVIIDNEDIIPEQFLRVSTIVDKAGLKKALRQGEIEGAHIEDNVSLQLK